jgi:hypothetical protein
MGNHPRTDSFEGLLECFDPGNFFDGNSMYSPLLYGTKVPGNGFPQYDHSLPCRNLIVSVIAALCFSGFFPGERNMKSHRSSMAINDHRIKRRTAMIAVALIFVVLCIGLNAGIAKAVIERLDYVEIIDRVDYDLLQRTEVTRYYYKLAWHHMDELTDISNQMTWAEILEAAPVFDFWLPDFRALLDGKGDTETIRPEQVEFLSRILTYYADHGSPSLSRNIRSEMDRLRMGDFVGMTMTEAWTTLHERWAEDDPTVMPFLSDPDDYLPQPAGELLPDFPYGPYWRVFRDKTYGVAFAYPYDWTIYEQNDGVSGRRRIRICNYDERSFVPDWMLASITCFKVEMVAGADVRKSLAEAAFDAFCKITGVMVCGPITHSGPSSQAPERVSFEYRRSEWPYLGIFMVVYRTERGDLINFSRRTSNGDREFNAVADSVSLTYDGAVRAPDLMAWQAQPWGPIIHEPRDLRITPSSTPTPWPTPYPLSVWTP